MGGCVAKPQGCIGRRSDSFDRSQRRKRKRRRIKNNPYCRKVVEPAVNQLTLDSDRSHRAPSIRGSTDEVWFDSIMIFESDYDDDFESVQEDAFSLYGYDAASESSTSSPDGSHHEDVVTNARFATFTDQKERLGEMLTGNSARSLHDMPSNDEHSLITQTNEEDANSISNDLLNHANSPVYVGKMHRNSLDKSLEKEEGGTMDPCGILPNACLPCLASSTTDMRKSFSPGHPSFLKKRITSKKKSMERYLNSASYSANDFVERPVAGSQVPFCPIEKKMLDSWSNIEPSSFKVRSMNYFKDKKKEFAPNYAAFYPFGVDVFLCQQKIDHIARFVELPSMNSSGKIPPILVVNVQVPLYPATFFQSENDGEGLSFVLYFRISDSYAKELPHIFQENIKRLINDDREKLKGFPVDSVVPFRERLKILGRVANIDDLHLSATERKLMHAYNEKPVLSRPQHKFYLASRIIKTISCKEKRLEKRNKHKRESRATVTHGENYFEIDVDMHRFSYISRKGFEAFQDRLKFCVLDIGFTIQGNKPEEMPEQILCCIRLSGIDRTNYHQLATGVAGY